MVSVLVPRPPLWSPHRCLNLVPALSVISLKQLQMNSASTALASSGAQALVEGSAVASGIHGDCCSHGEGLNSHPKSPEESAPGDHGGAMNMVPETWIT